MNLFLNGKFIKSKGKDFYFLKSPATQSIYHMFNNQMLLQGYYLLINLIIIYLLLFNIN